MHIDQDHTTAAGQEVLDGKGIALALVSNKNSYFSSERIAGMAADFKKRGMSFVFILPDEPEEANYEAFGYGKREAERKARTAFNQISNKTRRAMENTGISLVEPVEGTRIYRWKNIKEHPAYLRMYEWLKELYTINTDLRDAVQAITQEVLAGKADRQQKEDEFDINKGIEFILKEYAFLLASADIFGTDYTAPFYHRPMPLFEELLKGTFGKVPSEKNVGIITAEVEEQE